MNDMVLPTKRFTKVDEPFVCGHCGYSVHASIDGSCRNHCPRCLYSKHVDINPGDRLEECCGLMVPVDIEKRSKTYRILHKCTKCGYTRWNRAASDDDIIEYYEKKNF